MVELASGAQIAEEVIADLGLRRIETDELTIQRIQNCKGVDFLTIDNRPVERRDRKRIAELAIPPAWSDVRIAADRDAHLQAVGRDEAGRLQYIYHAAWEDVRSATKTFRLMQLGSSLSRLRRRIAHDLQTDSANLPLAAAARLVDALHLRAGHESYAGDEGGRGAATLLRKHISIDGDSIELKFRGKGGKKIEKALTDAALAAALAELRSSRGPRLFKLAGADGRRAMTANDLNAYLAQSAKRPVTAKDFRTLFASAAALDRLSRMPRPASAHAIRKAIAETAKLVSAELVNTPNVCRKSYILPVILSKFETEGLTGGTVTRARRNLNLAETRLLDFLAQCSAERPTEA